MPDAAKVARVLLESAATMAQSTGAKAIVVAIDALPEITALPPRTIVVVRDDADRRRLEELEQGVSDVIEVPYAELDRLGQVKLAAILALSSQLVGMNDTVVFLTGPFRSLMDTLCVMTFGSEYELFDTTDQPGLNDHVQRAVFQRALSTALHLGQHGREGKRIGCCMVIGDSEAALALSEQMILNPFKGYQPHERNLLDDHITETMREYSAIDGAFIIRADGVVETAGARLKASADGILPPGLGARHAAAAGITAHTHALAITVSESDGMVRVWRGGRVVADFAAPDR